MKTTAIMPELVLRINELYHDAEGEAYDQRHPEIFDQEVERWGRLRDRLLPEGHAPARVLDVGSGTGFVGLQLLPALTAADELVCADLSGRMLEVCRERLMRVDTPAQRSFVKITAQGLPDGCHGFDVITLNSVVHHLPDPDAVLSDLVRRLKPGGRLVMAHEPNLAFYHSRFRRWLASSVQWCFERQAKTRPLRRLLANLGVLAAVRRFTGGNVQRSDIFKQVNQRLVEEGFIRQPMPEHEIAALVDVHSPTSGDTVDTRRGFSPGSLERALPGTRRETLETYNHLGAVSGRNGLTRWLAGALERRAPERGATFVLVLQRTGDGTGAQEASGQAVVNGRA